MEQFQNVVKILEQKSEKNKISKSDVDIIFGFIFGWNISDSFPFFDILRMIVLNEEGAKRVFEKKEEMRQVLEIGLGNQSTNASQMMCFRLICNSFRFFELRSVVEEMSEFIFEKISFFVESSSIPVRLAICTVLLKFFFFNFNFNFNFLQFFDVVWRKAVKFWQADEWMECLPSSFEGRGGGDFVPWICYNWECFIWGL